MDAINIIVEHNAEHTASVYALVTSMIKNKYENSRYRIYLFTEERDASAVGELLALQECFITIEIVSEKEKLAEIGKAIYLKWNTLVLGDLTDLFTQDLEDCKIAAVLNLPAAIYYISESTQRYDNSVLLTDFQKTGIITDASVALPNEVKELPIFYNLGYSELLHNREKYKEENLKDITGLSYVNVEYLKQRAVILRMEQEYSPEQYFDHVLAELWMKYYKASLRKNTALRRSAYTETWGKISISTGEDAIPVAIQLSDKDVPYAVALLYSLETNLDSSRKLDVRIIYQMLSEAHKKMLVSMSSVRLSIVLYNVQEYADKKYFPQMLVPQIFDEYKKVLYLSPNMICCTDIGKLYDYRMEEYYVRAVKGILERDSLVGKKLAEDILLNDWFFADTSMMLINTEAWIRDGIADKIWKLMTILGDKDETFQSIFYRACGGKIGSVPNSWNHRQSAESTGKLTLWDYGDNIYEENSCMIQYDAPRDPWAYPEEKNAELVWKYISMSPHHEQLVQEAIVYDSGEEDNVQEVLERIEKLEKQNETLKAEVAKLKSQNDVLTAERGQFLYELLETRKSFTYKIGRFITFIPRKLRGTK